MTRTGLLAGGLTIIIGLVGTGCGSHEKVDAAAGAPPAANVETEPDLNIVKVDRPERFKLATAGRREDLPQIDVTGVVNPDIEKSIPVISLASGRVVGIYAKLGDDVAKGQLLLKVYSPDISNGFQTLRQAQADEALAQKQLERARLLYDKGAISLNDLQVAEDTEAKAKATLDAAVHAIRILGGDPSHEDPVINIDAPVSGTIVEQNITAAASVQSNNQPNLFTIANLSVVWVICNVYENDLPEVRVGDPADIELNAYRGRTFRGRVINIGKVLDATIRTAPVRVVLNNPGIMRAGMFVTATFYGQHGRAYATVPSGAVLHLHDRDWVFVPAGQGQFRRTEVSAGKIVDGAQDITSGISPGQQVAADALALSAESEQ
ncbi:MAG: efflux RND transporter periplasmic adaptor subunit [Acidobacteriaceae bacterium]|nr:efflux RND transporter periplasmic adaptor subunit [Acidobacteriaceae bacterium]